MNGNSITWCRKLAGLGLSLSMLCLVVSGAAQVAAIPASLQAELLAKLETYDRSFASRAGKTARVFIVVKPDSAKSELSANEMKSALRRIELIGGLPHEEVVIPYATGAALAERIRTERAAIVFIAADLDETIAQIVASLSGASVLTVGAAASYVASGIVLGFELESGRPRIVINLEQAKRQSVDFSSNVLRLMRVHR